ncbi:MAG: hypothetical protein R3296_14590 [Oleiphilaceae bacterium]|nr:hypothetical protein [Oleiphilaceae bacterium]
MNTVVLMDCEQRCAEGVLYSLARNGFRVVGLSAEIRFPARLSRHLSQWYHSPLLSQGFSNYLAFLQELPERGPLIPSGDLSVRFLSRNRETLERAGFLVNVPDPEELERLFDKWQCHRLCRDQGIPVAGTARVQDLESALMACRDMRWPLLLKPTTLAGGNYVRVHSEQALSEAFFRLQKTIHRAQLRINESGLILQEWVESTMEDNWSCDVFVDRSGRLQDAVTIQRVRTSLNDSGYPTSRMYCGRIRHNPLLLERTRQLLEGQQWRGFAHVEFIHSADRDEYLLTEVNPRLPGYAYLLSATGHEQACYYCRDLLGQPYSPPPLQPPQNRDRKILYFESLRYPGDITDGLVNMVRGHLGLKPFLRSYLEALGPGSRVIVDHFNLRDPGMTFYLQVLNARRFLRKLVLYGKRVCRSWMAGRT